MSPNGPVVQFARYVDGQVELFKEHTDKVHYLAVSHVWGEIEWRQVKGVPHEIKVSARKAKFIEDRLPALVGGDAFWMDTITVNQRDQAEVIDTVQSIPAIFRGASRTIAIREGDGLYNCCHAATEGFKTWEEFGAKLFAHHESGEHCSHVFDETYLLRLWTLQECQLSHTIQFVTTNEVPEKRESTYGEPLDPYIDHVNRQRVCDSLFVLAHSFDSRVSVVEFIRAYVSQGTITRTAKAPRTQDDDIYTDNFYHMNLASNRRATESRDYVFATMPQFPWNHYPADAELMRFNEIFEDFCQQSTGAGHPFSYRITRSMTNPEECRAPESGWRPSNEQPEPKFLGDFLKLLGQQIIGDSSSGVIHLCSVVVVEALPTAIDFSYTMETVESAMAFSQRIWAESHRGGELSRYGGRPEDVAQEDNHLQMAIYSWKNPGKGCTQSPEEVTTGLAALEKELDDKRRARLEITWLQKQALRILDLKWSAFDRVSVSKPHQGDWRYWSRDLPRQWSMELQRTVLLCAAMLSCQVPLSAVQWASERFVPVLVKFKTQSVLGLLAKHAYQKFITPEGEAGMICVGRHPKEGQFGKDLVLADIEAKVPVGLVPDFLSLIRTDDEYVDRVKELYHTLNPIVTPRGAIFKYVSLDAISVSKPSAG